MLSAELRAASGVSATFDNETRAFYDRWPQGAQEYEARWFVERLALLLQGSILLRYAPAEVSDAFIATRIGRDKGDVLGAISLGDTRALIDRI